MKILLKKSPAWFCFCCMAPLFNMFSISTCIGAICSWPICGVWETLSCVEFFKIVKTSGYFVSVFHSSKKCFNLPASGKFGTILAKNKLFTQGWTFLRSAIGVIGGRNMLRFPLCFFILRNPLLIPVGRQQFPSNIFCIDFQYLLSRKNFECCPPELLLVASKGVFQKDFCFFLPYCNYFNGLFF